MELHGNIPIVRVADVGSTNDVAFELLAKGMAPPFCIVADSQTNGRGYRGSSWVSNARGNIYLSIALKASDFQIEDLAFFSKAIVLKFVEFMADKIDLMVKWPNDIFCCFGKIGGVLLETKLHGKAIKYAVLGVGINVAVAPELDKLKQTSYRAASLHMINSNVSYDSVLCHLIYAYGELVNILKLGKLKSFVCDNWDKFDMFFDQNISLSSCGEIHEGICRGIDCHGRLVLRNNDGAEKYFDSANGKILI